MIIKLTKNNDNSIKEIMFLHEKSIFPIWDKLERKYNIQEIEKFVKDVLKNGEVYGYFIKKDFAGVIGIYNRRGKKIEIAFLLVNPKFQGKGIGKELMNFIETILKPKTIVLEVLKKNSAFGFYKKIGYKLKSEKGEKYKMEKILK